LAFGSSAAHAAPPLIGQWSLDGSYEDGATQGTADTSGNGLDLKAPSGAMHVGTPALFGPAATLPTNVTPMQVTSPVLAPAQVTLLAWIKQSGNPGTLRYLAGRGDDAGTCGGSTFAIYSGAPTLPGLRFYVRSGAGALGILTDAPADATVFDGRWHLVAGTYDGTAARLYIDGVQIGGAIPAAPPLKYDLGGGGSFYVDGYPVEGCSLFNNADDWPGPIDEVRLYDRALSQPELGRLAAATGPNAPVLIPDSALTPVPSPAPADPGAPAPTPGAAAGAASGAAGTGAAAGKLLASEALAKGAGSLPGASKKPVSAAAQAALESARAAGLNTIKSADAASQVGKATPVTGATKQERAKKPDADLRERLESTQFGLHARVPTAASGQAVEAHATMVVVSNRGGLHSTTIGLSPSSGVSEPPSPSDPGTPSADVTFPVDAAASKALAAPGTVQAAISIDGVSVDRLSELGDQNAQKLQNALAARDKASATLANILAKVDETSERIAKNARGGETPSERKEDKGLEAQVRKLLKEAKPAESQRDAANQAANQAMQPAVAPLVDSLTSAIQPGKGGGNAVPPAGSAALKGCKQCGFLEAAAA
jgi:hypothetical protein